MDPIPILFDQRDRGYKGAIGFARVPYIGDKISVTVNSRYIRLQRKLYGILNDFVGKLDSIRLALFHMIAHAIDVPGMLGWNFNVSV